MRQTLQRYRRRRRRPQEEGESQAIDGTAPAVHGGPQRLGPFYNAGPAHELPLQAGASGEAEMGEEEEKPAQTPPVSQDQAVEPAMPALSHAGRGEKEQVAAFLRGPLRLQGRTDATFDGGSYQTTGVRVRPGTGCDGCGECLHVTGTLVATYSVTTTVTLPSVSQFPDLTACQRQRVQNAIDTILAPHEQQHVSAFGQYNGTTRRRFDLTLCRADFDGAIDAMFQAEAQARQQAAQSASDALDPFHFDVDLDCEEPRQPARQSQTTGEAVAPPAEEAPV